MPMHVGCRWKADSIVCDWICVSMYLLGACGGIPSTVRIVVPCKSAMMYAEFSRGKLFG
jgi:hypothetical protein